MGKLGGAAESHELRAAACQERRGRRKSGHPAIREQSGDGGEDADVPERIAANARRLSRRLCKDQKAKDSGAGGRPGDRITGFSKKVTMSSRRIFLKNSALAIFGVGAIPAWLSRSVYAADGYGKRRKKILVAIFQRGAVDGLNMVVPFGEATLLPAAAFHRHSETRRHAQLARWIWTASSACIRRLLRSSRCMTRGIWRLSTPWARPIPRARTSTRRITWNPERRV